MKKQDIFCAGLIVSLMMASSAGMVYAEVITEDNNVPVLTIDSSLKGSAYTNGKSTLKYHLNTHVTYGSDSQAVFTLTMPDGTAVDDSQIDCSDAEVILDEGVGYYPSEYVFSATQLDGDWNNGQYTYTLEEGDLELDTSLYPLKDKDSGREWSCLGGDGHGNYHFNLTVSGIRYAGQEIAPQTFPVDISIFGFNYSNDAASLYGEDGTQPLDPEFATLSEKTGEETAAESEPVFTWVGEGEKPILCDHKEDDFYITWPEGTDASEITSADITVTLSDEEGNVKELTADQDFYVNSDAGETQIAITYQNWAFIPVYTTMTIQVSGNNASAEYSADIGSVYVYEAQQGGGGNTIDGTVTAYSFYGLSNLTSWEQIMSPAKYLLSVEQDGKTLYYAEDESQTPYLTENAQEAYLFDATGEDERNPQLIGNTVYITTKRDMKEIEKTVDGESITFTQFYPGWDSDVDAGGSLLSPSECDTSLTAEPGYVIPWGTENWITNEKWAWQKGVEEGWTGILVTPEENKYEWNVTKGTSEKFEASLNGEPVDVTWEIVGDTDEGTTVTQDGLVTVSENETTPQFAVTVTDADGNLGTVTIKVQEPEN